MEINRDHRYVDLYHIKDKNNIDILLLSKKKDKLKCKVSIDSYSYGTFDLLSDDDIKKLVDKFCELNSDWESKYSHRRNLIKLFEHICFKLRSGEITYIAKKEPKKITTEQLKFLSRPDLMTEIYNVASSAREEPFVGEERNLMIVILNIFSCYLYLPISSDIVGASSSGKTYMVMQGAEIFPKDNIMVIAGATGNTLKYQAAEIDEEGNHIVSMSKKCIIVLEKEENLEFVKSLKTLQSHDAKELPHFTPTKDEVSGGWKTIKFLLSGFPSCIIISCKDPKEKEEISRNLLLSTFSSEQTIENRLRSQEQMDLEPWKFEPSKKLKSTKELFNHMRRYRIINPFISAIREFFPKDGDQRTRDLKKVRGIIKSITLLHQYQRCKKIINGKEYLISSLYDNIIGLVLMDDVLKSTFYGIPKTTMEILLTMKNIKQPITIDKVFRAIRVRGMSILKSDLKNIHLFTLVDSGMVEKRKEKYILTANFESFDTYSDLLPAFLENAGKSFLKNYEALKFNAEQGNRYVPPNTENNKTTKVKDLLLKLGYNNTQKNRAGMCSIVDWFDYKHLESSWIKSILDKNQYNILSDYTYQKFINPIDLTSTIKHQEVKKKKVTQFRRLLGREPEEIKPEDYFI